MSVHTQACVVDATPLTSEIASITVQAVDGSFEGCAAGAHIDVHLPNGLVRNYSLTEWDDDGKWVTIAVKREASGRGGSIAMHDLRPGDLVTVAGPRNHFDLREGAVPVVLIAGGIGVTPIYAMARTLLSQGRPFDVHYLARAQSMAAFHQQFLDLELGDRYRLHCDDQHGRADFDDLLAEHHPDAHIYVCGPEVMLSAVQAAAGRLGRGPVFFERFAAVPRSDPDPGGAFQVVLGTSGEALEVPAGMSILDVLRDAGHDVDYACEEGACGTCIVDVVDGEIDHRDSILTTDEQLAGDCMCICVSRAKGGRLVLAL